MESFPGSATVSAGAPSRRSDAARGDLSSLADGVILLRGEVRQAISVMKKRSGNHERTIREQRLGPGVGVGPPLANLHRVLTGSPIAVGSGAQVRRGDGA